MVPRHPQDTPMQPQGGPKCVPRRPSCAPRCRKESPRLPKETPKDALGTPKRIQSKHIYTKNSRSTAPAATMLMLTLLKTHRQSTVHVRTRFQTLRTIGFGTSKCATHMNKHMLKGLHLQSPYATHQKYVDATNKNIYFYLLQQTHIPIYIYIFIYIYMYMYVCVYIIYICIYIYIYISATVIRAHDWRVAPPCT